MGAGYTPEERILEDELRRSYGQLVYSHTTQRKCAQQKDKIIRRIKLWQIILSAFASGSFITDLAGDFSWGKYFGSFLSVALLVLNSYAKKNTNAKEVVEHNTAAKQLWLMRERYLGLITDFKIKAISLEKAKELRDKLREELAEVYKEAPMTDQKCYEMAQKALKHEEEQTFHEDELDKLLPEALRRNVS